VAPLLKPNVLSSMLMLSVPSDPMPRSRMAAMPPPQADLLVLLLNVEYEMDTSSTLWNSAPPPQPVAPVAVLPKTQVLSSVTPSLLSASMPAPPAPLWLLLTMMVSGSFTRLGLVNGLPVVT